PATVTVIVTGLGSTNQPPVANDDSRSVGVNPTTFIDALTNDTDPDNDPLSIIDLTQPAQGSVVESGNGFLYSRSGSCINTSFTYTISDGNGGEDTATVTLIEPSSANFSDDNTVNNTDSFASGTVTISCGSGVFQVGAFGGSTGSSTTFVIDGASYSVSAGPMENPTTSTPSFPPGIYSYTLSGSTGGGGAAGSVRFIFD
ncbi:MAG: Ig-like domain-containing protein, partial [Maribacter sp.]